MNTIFSIKIDGVLKISPTRPKNSLSMVHRSRGNSRERKSSGSLGRSGHSRSRPTSTAGHSRSRSRDRRRSLGSLIGKFSTLWSPDFTAIHWGPFLHPFFARFFGLPKKQKRDTRGFQKKNDENFVICLFYCGHFSTKERNFC